MYIFICCYRAGLASILGQKLLWPVTHKLAANIWKQDKIKKKSTKKKNDKSSYKLNIDNSKTKFSNLFTIISYWKIETYIIHLFHYLLPLYAKCCYLKKIFYTRHSGWGVVDEQCSVHTNKRYNLKEWLPVTHNCLCPQWVIDKDDNDIFIKFKRKRPMKYFGSASV